MNSHTNLLLLSLSHYSPISAIAAVADGTVGLVRRLVSGGLVGHSLVNWLLTGCQADGAAALTAAFHGLAVRIFGALASDHNGATDDRVRARQVNVGLDIDHTVADRAESTWGFLGLLPVAVA